MTEPGEQALMSVRVEVDETAQTVVLTIDDQTFEFAFEPAGAAQDSVDQLRRIAAAAQHAVRLVRSPEARREATQSTPAAPSWLDVDAQQH